MIFPLLNVHRGHRLDFRWRASGEARRSGGVVLAVIQITAWWSQRPCGRTALR